MDRVIFALVVALVVTTLITYLGFVISIVWEAYKESDFQVLVRITKNPMKSIPLTLMAFLLFGVAVVASFIATPFIITYRMIGLIISRQKNK